VSGGLSRLIYEPVIEVALREDLGWAGDITTTAIVDEQATATADVVVRRPGRLAGIEVATAVFQRLDPDVVIDVLVADGVDVPAAKVVATLRGSARAVLTAERTALNLLGRMSGIATMTAEVVRTVEGTGARVSCTRKTTPGLRALEKYAVTAGGGINHRFGLYDAVMIKDNHIVAAGSISEAVRLARSSVGHMVKVEVEVDTLQQLAEVLGLEVDAVLCDNMSMETLREAVAMVNGRVVVEASGGITLETAREIAETGVDVLSIGWLTHSSPNLDVGLDFR
jgi:nicotinate-nucleotide pyrophosphorylase (carboxylating)